MSEFLNVGLASNATQNFSVVDHLVCVVTLLMLFCTLVFIILGLQLHACCSLCVYSVYSYQCIKLTRLAEQIVEIHYGKLYERLARAPANYYTSGEW